MEYFHYLWLTNKMNIEKHLVNDLFDSHYIFKIKIKFKPPKKKGKYGDMKEKKILSHNNIPKKPHKQFVPNRTSLLKIRREGRKRATIPTS